MKSFKTLAVIFIIFVAITSLHADDKIKIELKQPPPNKLGVGDLWNLVLNNTTDKEIKIFLTGTAVEEKDGLIIEGKSKVFTIKPGRNNYKYNDFSGAEVKYNNGKYKEIILRTGNAPEGSYTICVTAFDESGIEVGRENCIMQTVQHLGGITLLTPEDGEELDPVTLPGLVFSWTPVIPAPKDGKYTLRIVELKGDQSPEVAIKQNRAILEVDDIKTTTYHVAPSQVVVIMMGMKYAWQVSCGDVVSEVYWFKNNGIDDMTDDDIKVLQTPVGKTKLVVKRITIVGNDKLKAQVELTNNSDQPLYLLYGIAIGQPGISVNTPVGQLGISPDGELECTHEETVYYETFMIWFGENCVNLCEIAPSGSGINLINDSITVIPVTDFKSHIGANNTERADISFRFVASRDLKRIKGILKDEISMNPPLKAGEKWNLELETYFRISGADAKYDLKNPRQFNIEFTIVDDTGRISAEIKKICFCSIHKGFHECSGICVWPFDSK